MTCKPREPGWHHDPAQLQQEREAHRTFSAIAAAHGGHSTTYSQAWRRLNLPTIKPGPPAAADNSVDVTVDRMDDIRVEIRSRGLDPDEWVVIRVVVNTWDSVADGAALPLKQLKVTLRPRLDVLLCPASTDTLAKNLAGAARLAGAAKAAGRGPSRLKSRPRLVVFVGDEQAPYHDHDLHELFCQWLEQNTPDEAVHLGDLMDFPTISRHRTNPLWNATPQECIQAGYDILRRYREASPGTAWTALPGNHDERIRDYQLQRAPALFGVRPADLDERELAAVHSLPTLLHFDALGVSWRGSDADYEHAQVDVAPELVARHGFITGQNSAERTVKKLGLSVVVGHTHRQVVTYITEERRRETLTMLGIEAGCMCRIEGGLGYVVNPAWQNGAYAANVWPDGSFSGEHLTFRGGVLRWRDQRYELKRKVAA